MKNLQVPRPHYYNHRPPSPYVKNNTTTISGFPDTIDYNSVLVSRSPSPYYELKSYNRFSNWFYNFIQFF